MGPPTVAAKPERRIPILKAAITIVIIAVIIGGGYVILATPWIPVVKPYQHVEEYSYVYSYSYSYPVVSRSEDTKSAVIMQESNLMIPAYRYDIGPGEWIGTVRLERGQNIKVEFNVRPPPTQYWVGLIIYPSGRLSATIYGLEFLPSGLEWPLHFIVPETDSYRVHVTNWESREVTVSFKLTAEWVVISETTYTTTYLNTVTETATFTMTWQNVTYKRPID